MDIRIMQRIKITCRQMHGKLRWQLPGEMGFRRAIPDDSRHSPQAYQRLAQRPGRQQMTVANAAPVKHGDFSTTTQVVMLQTIVGDDHIALRMRRQQRFPRGRAVASNIYRRLATPGEQHGLITRQRSRRVGYHGHNAAHAISTPRGSFLLAVTTADYARPPAARVQLADQSDHERCFVAIADRQITDDNDGNGKLLGAQPT